MQKYLKYSTIPNGQRHGEVSEWSNVPAWKASMVKAIGGSNPLLSAIKTHAKGAYKTPLRVSFSMQNRGKLPILCQFTLFVVSSLIAVGICSSLALKSRKPLTIAQKGFLHDKERMILTALINEKMTDRTLANAVGRLLIRFLLLLFRTRTRFRFPCWTAQ